LNDTMGVTDPYLAAYAITSGLDLRGVRRDGTRQRLRFVFDAEPMAELFQQWGRAEVPTDLRRYLASLRYVRGRMASADETE